MGLRNNPCLETGHPRWVSRGSALRAALLLGVCAVSVLAFEQAAVAETDINTGSTVQSSGLSGATPNFKGGTLQISSSSTISKSFDLWDQDTNTIDINGKTATISGKLTGTGPMTFADSIGGGVLTLTGTSTYEGITTINSGVTLALAQPANASDTSTASGSIEDSAKVIVNGTLDISGTYSGASIVSLSGSGAVILGSEPLTISDADTDTFSGVISGKGAVVLTEGTETFTGINTYTGITTITSGTLYLTGNGSIANSSSVYVGGTLDLSGTTGTSLKSLAGSGLVKLGSETLTLTAASGSFSGVISGTGGLVLNSGTEYLTGLNTFTGGVTINAGTLEVGSSAITYNIANSGTFSFYSSSEIDMSGVISGTGDVTKIGTGVTIITTAQTYTGATTITTGTLKLSGSGDISSTSGVTDNGIFDISETSGVTLKTLSGSGTVKLGAEDLTLTSASGTFSGVISGTGNLIIAGGIETLSGASTYTGTTYVNGGTLALLAGSTNKSAVVNNAAVDVSSGSTSYLGSATIASLSGTGTVYLGPNTLVLSAATDTYYGVISGTGGLWISGGTETLAAANTYTGTTTVSAGTLVLSSTGSLAETSKLAINGTFDVSSASGSSLTFASLSGSGTVKLGTHSLTLSNASGAFSGVITGSGGLLVSGGTEILAGTNTYTGGTTIASGATLQIGTNLAAGSLVGDVADNGALAFARADTSVFSGTISGSGSVVQAGSGTTILTADNTYTGGTTINSGTLQIGNSGTSGSILGNVKDNGMIAFARSDTVSISATISGTGGLSQVSGTTILTSANSYTGSTKISSGATLALSGVGSISSSSGVTDNGTFDVSAVTAAPAITSLSGSGSLVLGSQTLTLTNASGTFSGTISGTGGLTISSGSETLSGTSSYTGQTIVSGGSLAVTGSIGSSSGVTINSGSKLSGTGVVSALTVNNGGTVEAGTKGSGTLSVNGAVTLASGSTFVVETSSSSTNKLSATGAATLGGTLTVTSTDGTYALGKKQTVLTAAGGVNGTFSFSSVASTGATFTSKVSYDANNVYLEIDLAKLSTLLPSTAVKNQINVVGGIDAAIAAGDTMPASFENLGNDTADGLVTDATQLSGELGADLPLLAKSTFSPFMDAMFDHMNGGRGTGSQTDVWMSGFGGTSIASGDATTGAHRFKTDVVGVVGGANWMLTPSIMLGGAVSVGSSNFRLNDNLGTGSAKSVQAGLYGNIQFSPHFYGSFAAGATVADIKTKRVLTVSGTDSLAGKLTATIYGARYETGISLPWVTPYIAVQDQLASLPAYSETASSGANTFALHYESRTANTGRAEIGIRQEMDTDMKPHWMLTPDGTIHLTDRIAWAHDFSSASDVTASFVGLKSSDFSVYGAKAGKDYVLTSFGADFRFNGGLHITTQLDGAFSSTSQSYTGYAGVGYRW